MSFSVREITCRSKVQKLSFSFFLDLKTDCFQILRLEMTELSAKDNVALEKRAPFNFIQAKNSRGSVMLGGPRDPDFLYFLFTLSYIHDLRRKSLARYINS